MIVTPPIAIADANFVSSTVAEPAAGESIWVASAAYTLGQVVIRTATHRRYRGLIAHSGIATAPESDPTRWVDDGPTIRWALFDLERTTATEQASGTMVVVLAPGKRIDSLGVVGISGIQSVRVEMLSGAGFTVVEYDRTINLSNRQTMTWSQYFFGEFRFNSEFLLTDLPLITGARIRLTFQAIGAEILKVQSLVLGRQEFIGITLVAATDDETNFSIIERTPFGDAVLTPRRSIPKTNHDLYIDSSLIARVRNVRADLNAKPALWSGLGNSTSNPWFPSFLVLGVYRKFTITASSLRQANISLEIEGI